jgi:predicted nuclease with TOPRIM domain
MIITIISGLAVGFSIAFCRHKSKQNKFLASESASYKAQSKRLLADFNSTRCELDRLQDRNNYLEGKLNTFTKENEMLGTKNDELQSLYLLAKEDTNRLKFQLIQLEESMKPKAKATKKKVKLTKKK